jgi:energy-coupling factor transporter ATP-binding protein EcfA2
MQLAEIEVRGLFGQFDHSVHLPPRGDEEAEASLVLLHGQNGVGKTTVLTMLDGLMQLSFDVFRRLPFAHCALRFTTGAEIAVEPTTEESALAVSFDGKKVILDRAPDKRGPLNPADEGDVDDFRDHFFRATDPIKFELIGTARHPVLDAPRSSQDFLFTTPDRLSRAEDPRSRHALRARVGQAGRDPRSTLGDRVRRFISEAQVEYRQFFSTTEPDLFSQIIHRLRGDEQPEYASQELINRLTALRNQDEQHARLGIEPDRWDLGEITAFLSDAPAQQADAYSLGIVGAYVEMLESRARERRLVASRLLTFERLMNDFYLAKRVSIDRRQGFVILTLGDQHLKEDQLSSGEYHLLYLMVSALLTRRRGTVLAIDEPEMSMHLSWQRRLVKSLVECASNAAPQFIFATHSPDVVANFAGSMVRLGPEE